MLNTGINQVVMVYEGTYATVQHAGEAREMMVNTMLHSCKLHPLESKHLSVIEPSNIFYILPNHHFPGNTQ